MTDEPTTKSPDQQQQTIAKSASLLRLRLKRFRRIRRGYYSFLVMVGLYVLSFLLPFLMGNRPIMLSYEGDWYFPAFRSYFHQTFGWGYDRVYLGEEFGQTEVDGFPIFGEADYRGLERQFALEDEGNWLILPPVPYSPIESFLDMEGHPPHVPSADHLMGTDGSVRDVFVRLAYGFRISISFALLVVVISYTIGTLTGALLGYFGRWVDILGLRLVEIWSSIPFLYTVIIISSIYQPSFTWLVAILAAFGWMGITYYVRGEFYREKSKDYVAAAIAIGEGHFSIIIKYILPNALTPIIAFAPFAIVGMISALVSLDFLGYGLPAPTPSWGELLRQAKDSNMKPEFWHLVVFPMGAMFLTLQLIVFIGEAVREAFDPKVFSRLH
jgi:microcin C transport system permease protein